MSVLFLSGFESGDLSEQASSSGTISVQSTVKRTGSYALKSSPTTTNTGYVNLLSSLSTTTPYLRFYFRVDTLPVANDEPICSINLTSYNLEVRISSTGTLAVYESTTSLATGTTTLATGTWYRIELSFNESTTAWHLYINGTQELTGTTGASQVPSAINLGKYTNRNGRTVVFYYDDVMVRDDQLPGAGQIECLLPNGAGFYAQYENPSTLGTGTYAQINQVPNDGSTTDIVPSGSNQASTFTFTTPLNAITSVNCVKWCAIAQQFSGGSLGARFRQSSTNADSTILTVLPSSWGAESFYYPTNPVTSSAWTSSDINSVEAGCICSSLTGGYVTALYLMVDYVPTYNIAGPNFAQTATTQTGIGTDAWLKQTGGALTTNALSSIGGDYGATFNGNTTNWLVATNFGFSIPTGSTIVGIYFEYLHESNGSATNNAEDNALRVVKGGTIGSTDRALTSNQWQTTWTWQGYGSSSDLWGLTWTVSDINASNFGTALSAKSSAVAGYNPFVDAVRATVYYLPSSTNTYNISGSGNVLISGKATNQAKYGVKASGYAIVGGSTSAVTFNITATGKVLISGTAVVAGVAPQLSCSCNAINLIALGNVKISGTAKLFTPRVPIGFGKAVISGSARVAKANDMFAEFEAYYMLQENGSPYTDLANGLNGTGGDGIDSTTVPTQDTGIFCSYSQLCSGRQFITMPISPNTTVYSPLTISCWVNINMAFKPKTFYARGTNNVQLSFGHTFLNQVIATVTLNINGTNTTYRAVGKTVLQRNYWYYLSMVYDPSNTLSVYVNAKLDGVVTLIGFPLITLTDNNSIACQNYGQFLEGNIEEVRVETMARDAGFLLAERASYCDQGFVVTGAVESP